MVAIKNPFLEKQFEQFLSLKTEGEKKAFLKQFEHAFDGMSETEKSTMQSDWKENMEAVKNRLNGIGRELDTEAAAIHIFPVNAEERRLVEAVLAKMNVRYMVA